MGIQPFQMQALFHNYLSTNIDELAVTGFDGLRFYNKVKQKHEEESRTSIHISEETDNVYASAPSDIQIHTGKSVVTLSRIAPANGETVLWNPGPEKTRTSFSDLEDDDYSRMVCVEPGVGLAGNRMVIVPGQIVCFSQLIQAHGTPDSRCRL
jgi:glucose-6-phosphate 1-epimerase